MDSLAKTSTFRYVSPLSSPLITSNNNLGIPSNSQPPSFPIIAIAIIGILSTAFLLVAYYVFVIKCCLNWHRIDLLRRLSRSSSTRQPLQPPLVVYSPEIEIRGLHESVIRSIPLLQYKESIDKNFVFEERSFSLSECAICLSEFEQDEMLRVIPICNHLFHIDCIDVWLQNNSNCPLCRMSINSISSSSVEFGIPTHQRVNNPSSSTSIQDPNPQIIINGGVGNEDDFVVIDLGGIRNDPCDCDCECECECDHHHHVQIQNERDDGRNSGELPVGKLEERMAARRQRKLQKVMSFGDEWIDLREKDEQFCIQPIRRSVSMDLSAARQLYAAAVAAEESSHVSVVSPIEGCNGRVKRSFFSFGYGRSSRTTLQTLPL